MSVKHFFKILHSAHAIARVYCKIQEKGMEVHQCRQFSGPRAIDFCLGCRLEHAATKLKARAMILRGLSGDYNAHKP